MSVGINGYYRNFKTYRFDEFGPISRVLDHDLDGNVRAVLFEELSEHLTL